MFPEQLSPGGARLGIGVAGTNLRSKKSVESSRSKEERKVTASQGLNSPSSNSSFLPSVHGLLPCSKDISQQLTYSELFPIFQNISEFSVRFLTFQSFPVNESHSKKVLCPLVS